MSQGTVLLIVHVLLHGDKRYRFVCWLLACLTSQQQASVSQGRICRQFYVLPH